MVKKSGSVDVEDKARSGLQQYLADLRSKLVLGLQRFADWLSQGEIYASESGCPTEGRYLRSCYIVFRVHDHYELIHIEENRQASSQSEDGLNEGTVELFSELLSLESDWISQQQQRESGRRKPEAD